MRNAECGNKDQYSSRYPPTAEIQAPNAKCPSLFCSPTYEPMNSTASHLPTCAPCPLPLALCSMHLALCPVPRPLCSMPVALCSMPCAYRPISHTLYLISYPLYRKPENTFLIFLKHYRSLNSSKQKTAKVCPVLPDTGVEGKIAVRKGGGWKMDRLLVFQTNLKASFKKYRRERQNKNLEEEIKHECTTYRRNES